MRTVLVRLIRRCRGGSRRGERLRYADLNIRFLSPFLCKFMALEWLYVTLTADTIITVLYVTLLTLYSLG